MAELPLLQGVLLLLVLVLAVGQDVQELQGGLVPDDVPGAAERLAYSVDALDPSPGTCRSIVSSTACILALCVRLAVFAAFSKEVREA